MSAVATAPAGDRLTVVVSDPFGQAQVRFDGVQPSATAHEIMAMAMSELRLPPLTKAALRAPCLHHARSIGIRCITDKARVISHRQPGAAALPTGGAGR